MLCAPASTSTGGRASAWWWSSFPQSVEDEAGEVVAALAVRGVPIERGAGGREEHGVARLGGPGGGLDGFAHRRRGDDGADALERVGHLLSGLADGDDGAHVPGAVGEHVEVAALVAATGDEHDGVEGADGGEGG